MKVLKTINRKILSPLLYNVKGDRIIRSFSENSILNIMYHGVTLKNSNYFSPRHISSDQFERHLKYFSTEFDVISLSKAFEYLKDNHKPKRKTLTITFDDGYRNNLSVALPLLEKYNMQATFFISAVCTEEMRIRALWPDIISCLTFFHKDQIIELGNEKFRNFIGVESNISLGEYLSTCEISTLTDNLNYLISKYDVEREIQTLPDEMWKLLNKNELRDLSASRNVEIGSHGHSHYKLANLDIAASRKELEMSKALLQGVIGKEISIVAYPFGSYNPEIKDLAMQLGYNYQMAVDYIYKEDVNDVRILNRHGIPSTTTYEANILLLNNAFRKKGYN